MESITLWRATPCCVSVRFWHATRYYDLKQPVEGSHFFTVIFAEFSLFCIFCFLSSFWGILKFSWNDKNWRSPLSSATQPELATQCTKILFLHCQRVLPVENICFVWINIVIVSKSSLITLVKYLKWMTLLSVGYDIQRALIVCEFRYGNSEFTC